MPSVDAGQLTFNPEEIMRIVRENLNLPLHDEIPKSVRILGRTFGIEVVNVDEDFRSDRVGMCNHNRLRIRLSDHSDIQEQKDTILHEVIHAIDNILSLEMEEEQVRRLSAGVYAVLRDNPGLGLFLSTEAE